ncbi:CBD9-like protein [Lojkania enalia]|uniref:CBD9-like protein n=1 Tax=Lojkania enalia TaxID=147567 RepID=A0A9P4N301_9PLEO|nr:CBD9-like protein [Didymosphaeria enalia]
MGRKTTLVISSLLSLATHTTAQLANVCRGDICFRLNIPESTAASGEGDIFFQISAPSSYEWVALGQGSQMSGSNIFVVYTSSSGENVTLSPRLGTGYTMPDFNGNAEVTLLEGSGVTDGTMIANVRCSNCNSWSGNSADFTADSGQFIYGAQTSGGPMNSDDQRARISQHDINEAFNWNWASAKGGNSVNPLVNAAPSGTASGGGSVTSCVPRPSGTAASVTSGAASATATQSDYDSDDNDSPTSTQSDLNGWWTSRPSATGRPWGPPDKRGEEEINYCDDSDSFNNGDNGGFSPISSTSRSLEDTRKMLIAHGVLAALAFVIFFPAGAIAIRLASFPGVVWFHAVFQAFAYLVYIAAFGLGIYIANQFDMLDRYHPIIGIVVFVCLFFQPLFGFLHHSLFKKYQNRTFWSYAHLWLGRLVITLGIINGGLGFMLADTMNLGSRTGMIVYSVVAAIIWLVWVAASIYGEIRRKKSILSQPPKYSESPPARPETTQPDVPHPEDGHYAPGPK